MVHSPALPAIVIQTAETPTRMGFRIGAKPRPQRGVRVGRRRRGCINRTTTNMTVGTVAYCAPEQLLGEDVDERADQYSLAAAAYHLLTGSQLFPHSNPAVVISRHLNHEPPTLANTRPELARLDPVLATGLAKRPDDRFKRCSEFARALGDEIDSVGGPTAWAPTTPAPVRKPAPPAASIPDDEPVDDMKRRIPGSS